MNATNPGKLNAIIKSTTTVDVVAELDIASELDAAVEAVMAREGNCYATTFTNTTPAIAVNANSVRNQIRLLASFGHPGAAEAVKTFGL